MGANLDIRVAGPAVTARMVRAAALISCLLVAACGQTPPAPSAPTSQVAGSTGSPASIASPGGSASASPTAGATLGVARPILSGTHCGVTATFYAQPGAAPPPTPAGSTQPAWSAHPESLALASVAISPDGNLLAIGQGARASGARLLTATGAKAAVLAGGAAAVSCLAWSPDGSLLAGARPDGTVAIWDARGRLVRVLPGTDPALSLAWSPDGEILATGAVPIPPPTATGALTLPGLVRLWGRDGSLRETLETQYTGGKFFNLAWSPDGSLLAAGAQDYHIWNANGRPAGAPRGGGDPAWAMDWSPDGRSLAIGDESGTLLVAALDGTVLTSAPFDSDVDGVAFSPDGGSVAVGEATKVTLVKASNGTQTWSVPADGSQTIWSSDGLTLLIEAGGGLALMRAGGTRAAQLAGCHGNITAFAWQGASVVAVTDAGWVCGWAEPEG